MTVPVEGFSFATVADYEARYGDVPLSDEARIQLMLDDASDLIAGYLGESVDEVMATRPGLLRTMTTARVHLLETVPTGVRSESVGTTSVTYATVSDRYALAMAEKAALDNALYGPGTVGALESLELEIG